MINYSVIITHYNRETNLKNTLEGLNFQNVMPNRVIVVNMGKKIIVDSRYNYSLEVLEYPLEWDILPLASARNFGAAMITDGQLVFLDVDCIPSPDFCMKVSSASESYKALVMGTPKYLLSRMSGEIQFTWLRENSVYHPLRPNVQSLQQEYCFELFWSLCFSIPKNIFERVGGFDKNYRGYGAEDTDFALTVRKREIPFYLSEAEVYHQQHPVYIPPINHLNSIVANCNYYKNKWGDWPMADCLSDFVNMNLIEWNANMDSPAKILRLPSVNRIARHLVKNAPYR